MSDANEILEGRVPAYLDTNILLRLAQNDSRLGGHVFEKLKVIYSDALFADLEGAPKYAIEYVLNYLEELGALKIVADNGTVSLIASSSPTSDHANYQCSLNTEKIEHALHQFSLLAHESKSRLSIEDIGRSFANALVNMIDQIDELREYPSIKSHAKSQIEELFAETAKIHGSNVEPEFKAAFGRTDIFSGIRPPGIIDHIITKFGSVPDSFVLFPKEPNWEGLVAQSATLSLLRFARDKGINSSDLTKAMHTAKTASNDDKHIAYALHCLVFLTGDRKAAKRAFALAEFHDRPFVILCQRRPDDNFLHLSGDSWDQI